MAAQLSIDLGQIGVSEEKTEKVFWDTSEGIVRVIVPNVDRREGHPTRTNAPAGNLFLPPQVALSHRERVDREVRLGSEGT